jgi:hypothetical protein
VELATSDGRRYAPSFASDAGIHERTGPTHELIAIAEGKTPGAESPDELGARTVELVDASYRGVRSGRPELVASAARPEWLTPLR